MNDEQRPLVAHEYRVVFTGRREGLRLRDLIAFLQQHDGIKMLSTSSGLICAVCLGRGTVVRPDHQGCIVLESDRIACPAGCEDGSPTDEARHAAIRAREV